LLAQQTGDAIKMLVWGFEAKVFSGLYVNLSHVFIICFRFAP